jgi:hypothetical protein
MTTQQVTARDSTHLPSGLNASGQPLPATLLPAWESFTTADRQRLVQTILHAAQHHLSTVQGAQTGEWGR